jgi:hypothetical protein
VKWWRNVLALFGAVDQALDACAVKYRAAVLLPMATLEEVE